MREQILLKIEYNQCLDRFKKAERFFSRQDVSQEVKEKWIPLFEGIIDDMIKLLDQIEDYDEKEVYGGMLVQK